MSKQHLIRATVVEPVQSTSPDALLALAVQQGADMDKLQKLMDLRDRWEAGEARKAYVAAMAAFKAEPIDIRKSKSVGYSTSGGDFVGYKHATVADAVDAVVPAMAAHGLSHSWDVKQEGGQITVTCTITHALGHRESVSMTAAADNSGKKNPIQQIASTVTYLQRYTLMSATGVAAKEMDDDATSAYAEEDGGQPEAYENPAVDARRKAQHDAAYARHSESITFIKDRIAASDLKAVADEWFAIPQDDQMALWLATTKGGCLTTAERRTIKEDLPKAGESA